MFVIKLDYIKPIEEIEQHLVAHRVFLDDCYKNNYYIVAGARNPRTGGIIISQLRSKNELINILEKDPFVVHGLVSYEIVEFNPVKYHPDFAIFIEQSQKGS